LKLAMFEKFDLDAMVFPYQTSFASPISNPVLRINDPTFVPSTRPQPSIFAGYSSVGFPGIVVPMGIGSQGLPMTISFMGRPYSEGQLLGYAYDYEQASRQRAPSPLMPPLQGETLPAPTA
jgi:amidase